jgi:outer membrane protein OmpA-like peptidoglycan-associated protein
MSNRKVMAIVFGISIMITGCSHSRYGEDIAFSHSLPPKSTVVTCACEALVKTQELLEVIVFFGTDLYALNEEATATLESMVQAINGREIETLNIIGHTDSRASDTYNDLLSKRRAQAVIDFLKGRGLTSQQINVSWLGEKAPAVDNSTPHGMALNRRTVVTANVTNL